MGDALDGKARAITDALAEGDAAGGIGRSGEVVHSGLDVALLVEQHLAHVLRHAPSVPGVLGPIARTWSVTGRARRPLGPWLELRDSRPPGDDKGASLSHQIDIRFTYGTCGMR